MPNLSTQRCHKQRDPCAEPLGTGIGPGRCLCPADPCAEELVPARCAVPKWTVMGDLFCGVQWRLLC